MAIVTKKFKSPSLGAVVDWIAWTLKGVYRIYHIIPLMWRLSSALAIRKIAILGDPDQYDSLRNLLVDSGLFKEKNIHRITDNEIGKVQTYTLLLMHWKSFGNHIEEVLRNKGDGTALIIYAPYGDGPIDTSIMARMEKERNVVVVNFRGRLLNDMLTSLITTSYYK